MTPKYDVYENNALVKSQIWYPQGLKYKKSNPGLVVIIVPTGRSLEEHLKLQSNPSKNKGKKVNKVNQDPLHTEESKRYKEFSVIQEDPNKAYGDPNLTLVKENDKALLWRTNDNNYEVWFKMSKPRSNVRVMPTDEDFGVWAWSIINSLPRAEDIFNEITNGTRKITPMTEDKETLKEK